MSRFSLTITLSLTLGLLRACAEPTPPIMPATVETPLPPAVMLPAPEAVPAEMSVETLSASETARLALRFQPSMTVAQAGVTAAQARVRQTESDLRPSLAVTGSYTGLPIAPDDGGGRGFATGASLRKLLYDTDHTGAQVRQSIAQHQAARAGLSRAQSDLVFQVKQAYYTLVQSQRLIVVQESNLRNRQNHLAQAKARVQAGVGLPIDVVRAEAAVNEATLSLIQARNAAVVARVTLAQTIGLDPRTPIPVGDADEPGQPADDLNALLGAALQARPEIAQARAALLANEHALAAAKTTNAPTYTGLVGLGLRDNHFPPNDATLSVGVSVSWNATDGGFTRARIAEVEANLAAAQAQLRQATLAVQADVSQAYLNLLTAQQRVMTADAGVRNAQEAVRLAQGRYNAGLGTFLDVLDAQNTLVTAETNRVNAQSAVNQAHAALAHALNNDPALLE